MQSVIAPPLEPINPPPNPFAAAAGGAFFNYMGLSPNFARLPAQQSPAAPPTDTASYMAGMLNRHTPGAAAAATYQPPAPAPFPEPEPPPLDPFEPEPPQQQPPRPLSLPEIASPSRGSSHAPSASRASSGLGMMRGGEPRRDTPDDYGARALSAGASSDDTMPVSSRRPVVSRQSILSRGSVQQASRGGSRGFNDTGEEFWSNDHSRKKHRRIKCSVDEAIELIREKITGRNDGRAGWLRRAFVQFDTDGSGGISHDEFVSAVEVKTALVFDEEVLKGVMQRFDSDGSGKIVILSRIACCASC